jgi:hypothetical protein
MNKQDLIEKVKELQERYTYRAELNYENAGLAESSGEIYSYEGKAWVYERVIQDLDGLISDINALPE